MIVYNRQRTSTNRTAPEGEGAMVQRGNERINDDLAAVLSMPEKRALSDDVASRLRAAILSGAFAPGERLREEALARALGVSRGPVREALSSWNGRDWSSSTATAVRWSPSLSRVDLEELYTLRLAIEELAIRRAAEASDPAAIARHARADRCDA